MTAPNVADFVDEYHQALDEFFRGDPEPAKALYSHREDASLANPFGPVAVGWLQVEQTMERAASNYKEGRATGFETLATYVTPELAYLVEVERFEARIGDQTDTILETGLYNLTQEQTPVLVHYGPDKTATYLAARLPAPEGSQVEAQTTQSANAGASAALPGINR